MAIAMVAVLFLPRWAVGARAYHILRLATVALYVVAGMATSLGVAHLAGGLAFGKLRALRRRR